MKEFRFGGAGSLSYGLRITAEGIYDAPERDIEAVSVPGRNGDLLMDNGRYRNITVTYRAGLVPGRTGMAVATDRIRTWLCRKQGYLRLEDDFDPYCFRMGRYAGPIQWTVQELERCGEAEIRFDCKPQRYYCSGEQATSYFDGNSIDNPYLYPALPLIRVTGAGTVRIGGVTVEVLEGGREIVLDCERMDAYYASDGDNANGVIRADSFPVLQPGANAVALTGDIEVIVVTPRWWSL